jgi:hypothetical protein
MTSVRSPRRKSLVKKSRSPRRKSPVKKYRSPRRKSPVKKYRSPRRKSPLKKSRSPHRKSPVKKSKSPRRKSPKRMLKGGGRKATGSERRRSKKEKPESDASEVATEPDTLKVAEESDRWTLTGREPSELTYRKEREKIIPLEDNLYRRNDPKYNEQIKVLRDFYIALWNKYNGYHYDPLRYHPLKPKLPLTSDQKALRKYYNDITNSKSLNSITNNLNKGRLLYSTEYEETNQNILKDPRMFVYSIDSINRYPHRARFPRNPKINFQVSPNSFEIHCNTNNKNTSGENIPARFFGHVTLILTRDLTPDQIGKIMSYTEDNEKSDAQKHFSEIYHYGASIFKGEIVESWWQTFEKLPEEKTRDKSVTLDERDIMNIQFGTETYFPDCSVGKFMKEYYLYCINTCPIYVVFAGAPKSGYSTLTIRDFTNWGSPKTLLHT